MVNVVFNYNFLTTNGFVFKNILVSELDSLSKTFNFVYTNSIVTRKYYFSSVTSIIQLANCIGKRTGTVLRHLVSITELSQ